MTSELCRALRDVECGRVALKDFGSPMTEVLIRSLQEYGRVITIADLRRHLLACADCSATATVAWTQLRDFDREQTDKLVAGLDRFGEALSERLRREGDDAEREALDLAEEISAFGENDSEDLVKGAKSEFLALRKNHVFLWAIKVNILLGELTSPWVESFLLSPSPSAASLFDGRSWRLRLGDRAALGRLMGAEGFVGLVAGSRGLTSLLRSFYLRDAFPGLSSTDLTALLRGGQLPVIREEGPLLVNWEIVWEHYSLLARLEAGSLGSAAPAEGPLPSSCGSQFQVILERLAVIEGQNENLLGGQTAVMDAVLDLVSAQDRLLRGFQAAPEVQKKSCEQSTRDSLGPIWTLLTEESRKFMLAAEYYYCQMPPDLDFSPVVVGFTKAFECELKIALRPAREALETAMSSDVRIKTKRPVERLTLGELSGLFERNTSAAESALRRCGLDLACLCREIPRVNMTGPRHLDFTPKRVATSFREIFLGARSVLEALFPPTRKVARP
jgi:hypothetical protein